MDASLTVTLVCIQCSLLLLSNYINPLTGTLKPQSNGSS